MTIPEFHVLRVILGVVEAGVAIQIIRRNLGYLWWFGVLLWFSAAFEIAPNLVASDAPWRSYFQVPCLTLLFALTVASSFDVFTFLRPRTDRTERVLLFQSSVAVGYIIVLLAWIWRPEDSYQGAMVIRQYLYILLTVATVVAWKWVTALDPVEDIPELARVHGSMWMYWLCAGLTEAISTKGGLLWMIFPWKDGMPIWRVANDLTLICRIALSVGWIVSLRRFGSGVAPISGSVVRAQLGLPSGFRTNYRQNRIAG